jgi:hypothetical protein
MEQQVSPVLDGPLNGLAAFEIHRLRYGRREVDVPLFTLFAFDKLHLGGIAHQRPPSSI